MTVLVLILQPDTNRGLIVKRSQESAWMPNRWSLIGGPVREGEEPSQAIKRCAWEEVGLSIGNLEVLRTFHDVAFGDFILFLAEAQAGEVTLDSENSEFEWVDRSHIWKYVFVPHCRESLITFLPH